MYVRVGEREFQEWVRTITAAKSVTSMDETSTSDSAYFLTFFKFLGALCYCTVTLNSISIVSEFLPFVHFYQLKSNYGTFLEETSLITSASKRAPTQIPVAEDNSHALWSFRLSSQLQGRVLGGR